MDDKYQENRKNSGHHPGFPKHIFDIIKETVLMALVMILQW